MRTKITSLFQLGFKIYAGFRILREYINVI